VENLPLKPKIDHPQVQIGEQIWMAKNLDVESFRNGDKILECKSAEEWEAAGENKTPAWCYYDFAAFNGKKYGKLYNWYAVNDERGLSPEGWHIPSDEEWSILINYVGKSDAGFKLKDKNTWRNSNGSDALNFGVLPGGSEPQLTNEGSGYYGYFWTSAEDDYINENEYPYAKKISFSDKDEVTIDIESKYYGFSVRCLKGNVNNKPKSHPKNMKSTVPNCQSDFDADGVCDRDDSCPETAGPVENGGCPVDNDLDDDGVLNDIDLCPKEYGPASNNGCPQTIRKQQKTTNDKINDSSETGKPNVTGEGENPFRRGGFGGNGPSNFGSVDNGEGDGTTCDNTPTNLNTIINLLKNNVPVTKPTSATVSIKIKADGSVSSVSVTGLGGAEASVERKIKEIVMKSQCTKCNGKNKNSRSYSFPKIVLKQD
jgi:uncharacterized protein (TIGR02145 family)